MLVKSKDNPSTTNAFFLKQVSCVNIMETNNQQKSGRCQPGYSGKQCTRKYQLLIVTRLVQLVYYRTAVQEVTTLNSPIKKEVLILKITQKEELFLLIRSTSNFGLRYSVSHSCIVTTMGRDTRAWGS